MGMASQIAEREDSVLCSDVRDKLFGPMEFSRRDLGALNIMRGRDNGLPDYNTVRKCFKVGAGELLPTHDDRRRWLQSGCFHCLFRLTGYSMLAVKYLPHASRRRRATGRLIRSYGWVFHHFHVLRLPCSIAFTSVSSYLLVASAFDSI